MAFIQRGAIILNKSRQTVMNNQPLFSVGNSQIAGYISVAMYDQTSSSAVDGGGGGSGLSIFEGTSQASGKPFVIVESVTADTFGIGTA